MNEIPSWFRILLYDWQRRLSAIFVWVLLQQYVSWIQEERTIWLHETIVLVQWTLLLTFLMELLPRTRLWIRLLFQFIVVLVFSLLAVGYQPVGGGFGSWDQIVQLWNDNAGQLVPFVWFIFGAWLIYLYCLWWINRKWRIAVLIGVSVTVLAIRDSFSLLHLWDEVAMTVLSGLSLLVICHFNQLKRKNPVGWAYLAEYPVSAVLPVVLFITFVMAIGVLVPEVPPTLKDPYTLYKEWRGEPVPAFGKGLGIAGLSGSASSGYGRNDLQLGGGFDFDYEPVMMVDTSHRAYWRGETRSLYNGKGWEATDADKQTGINQVASEKDLQQDQLLNNSKLKYVEVTQTITMEKPESYPVLFGAYSIGKILNMSGDNVSFDRLTWSSRQQELRFQESRGGGKAYPKTYTIVSEMPVVDEAGLRTVTMEQQAGMDDYLQLPSSVPARVKDLAQQITAGSNNPFDKVKLLEQYLQKTYPYTNKPESTLGKSKDFVDRFLFEIKEGYCDYYSTAMAVMTRAIGLPSRWVKGYSSGTSPNANVDDILQSQMEDPDGPGVYTVRNSDAHSWVEVYFKGWGWIPFEPTSGFTMPAAVLPTEITPLPDLPAVSLGLTDDTSTWMTKGRVTAGVTVLVLAIAAAALFYMGRRYNWLSLLGRETNTATLNHKIILEYNRLIRYSKRRGYQALEHETVRETFLRWMKKDVWLGRDYEAIVSLFEKAKYSGRTVTTDDAEQMTQLIKKLREEM